MAERQELKISVLTAFPGMFPGPLGESVPGRILASGAASLEAIDLRRFTQDRHRSVDDAPYGGGGGMVLMPGPVVDGVRQTLGPTPADGTRILVLSPQGRLLDHDFAVELSLASRLVMVCGRYKGYDARIIDVLGAEEISVGDYVLSGGELGAMVVIDSILRLLPGALGNFDSAEGDSFYEGLLEGPVYTRPQIYEGREVPAALLSGNHAEIRRWKLEQALRITGARRPDLLARRELSDEEERLMQSMGLATGENSGQEREK